MDTSNSVIGIANHIAFAETNCGSTMLKIPLIMKPCETEIINDVLGYIKAWK